VSQPKISLKIWNNISIGRGARAPWAYPLATPLGPIKFYTALQTVRHRFNKRCVVEIA